MREIPQRENEYLIGHLPARESSTLHLKHLLAYLACGMRGPEEESM
jgi:hypothetical protein